MSKQDRVADFLGKDVMIYFAAADPTSGSTDLVYKRGTLKWTDGDALMLEVGDSQFIIFWEHVAAVRPI